MRSSQYFRIALAVMAMNVVVGSAARGQVLSPISSTSNVTLRTFSPVDSTFINPKAGATFNIALLHTVSGSPTEYRVSRFADFRDASWSPYAARPTLTVPGSWFPPAVGGVQTITLHLQLRAKNPLAGRPISVIGGVTKVQPDFFFSEPLGRRIRLIYSG